MCAYGGVGVNTIINATAVAQTSLNTFFWFVQNGIIVINIFVIIFLFAVFLHLGGRYMFGDKSNVEQN